MNIIGLNIFHADSSAVLIKDGNLLSAAEEERFNRIKHSSGFPYSALNFCLTENNIKIQDIDYFAVNTNFKYNFYHKIKFSIKNIRYFKNILQSYSLKKKKINVSSILYNYYGYLNKKKIIYVPHHFSHISSSYFFSSFKDAICISIDGSGDFSTMEIYLIKDKKFSLIKKKLYPYSLGLFYLGITQYLGFQDYGDEYKVMGLASFGNPIYVHEIKKIIDIDKIEYFKMNMNYFKLDTLLVSDKIVDLENNYNFIFNKNLEYLLGPKRNKGEEITQKHKDIAASAQKVFEEIVIYIINKLYDEFKIDNLCLAGGCFFNASANGQLKDNINFKNIFIQPNAGDGGGALGAAAYVSHKFSGNFINKKISNLYLGSEESDEEIKKTLINKNFLNNVKYKVSYYQKYEELINFVSDRISESKIIAWHQGKFEFGPRALGNRSILADPRDKNIKDKINLSIKNRETFRPFAPSVLSEFIHEYFELPNKNIDYSFMNYVCNIKKKYVNIVPGAVHVDNTCRIQSVTRESNYKFYDLINSFFKKTNVPLILNTSLNINEPISLNAETTLSCLERSGLDFAVINNWVIEKIK